MPFVSFLHESRRRIETGSRQIAYDADWPGRIVCPSLAGEEAGGKASKASQKSPGTPAHMAGALPLAKRSAQSEVARAVVDVDVYHAFTLLRKLDDDGPEGYACEMRERRMMRPGLSCRVVSCRALSYRTVCRGLVPLSLSSADPLLHGFASLELITTMRLSDSSTPV
jgi:hypothetical protein